MRRSSAPAGGSISLPEDARGFGRRFVDRLVRIEGRLSNGRVSYGPIQGPPTVVAPQPLVFPEELEGRVACLRRLEPVDLGRLGEELGWLLFPAGLRKRLLAEVQDAEANGQRLRLRVCDDDSELGALPWEYAAVAPAGFLALHPNCSISRVSLRASCESGARDDVPTLATASFRCLVVYADPKICAPQIAANAEVRAVVQVLREVAGAAAVGVLGPSGQVNAGHLTATRANLARALDDAPTDVLVIIAHGDVDPDTGETSLYLETGTAEGCDRVGGEDLARLTRSRFGTPALIVLDVCWSAAAGAGGTHRRRGVAAALAESSPAVIGMQFLWPEAACLPFVTSLFRALAAPMPIDDALFAARETVLRIHPHTGDWGCPVLHRSLPPPLPRPSPPTELLAVRQLRALIDTLRSLDAETPAILRLGELLRALEETAPEIVAAASRGDADSMLSALFATDPLRVILAASPVSHDAVVDVSPIWCTRLLDWPVMTWVGAGRGGPWRLRLEDEAGRSTTLTLSESRLDLRSAAIGFLRGAWIRWTVICDDATHVRGVFVVADRLEASALRERSGDARARATSDVLACLYSAERWMEKQYYEAARGILHDCLGSLNGAPGADTFVLHRALAAVYVAQVEELSGRRFLGHPEGLWAATIARRHVEAALHSLDLSEE